MPQLLTQTDGNSYTTAVATNAAGDVFVAGNFTGTVIVGTTTLVSAGITDVFVAKWSPANNRFEWAKRVGGSARDEALAIVARDGSVYVAGKFYSAIADFGAVTLTNADDVTTSDAFVMKLTDRGTNADFSWAQRIGGPGTDEAGSLALSESGVYVGGSFVSETANFGNLNLTHDTAAGFDGFVAKLSDIDGGASFDWVRLISGDGFDEVYSLAVSGNNVYVAGSFTSDTTVFGSLKLANSSPFKDSGLSNGFVARLTDNGTTANFTWAQRAGFVASTVAANGNSVYVAGFIVEKATFGDITLTESDGRDMYVAKLTDQGDSSEYTWVRQIINTNRSYLSGIVVRGANVYVTGIFDTGPLSVGDKKLINASDIGTDDIFVVLLTDQGSTNSVEWAQQAGGVSDDWAAALAITTNGSIYIVGSTYPPVSFGRFTVARTSKSRVGYLAALSGVTLATKTPSAQLAFDLWPNPAQATTTLRLPALPATTRATLTLTLCDALGRAVRRYNLSSTSTTHELNLIGLAPGLYILHVQTDAVQATRRLVVE